MDDEPDDDREREERAAAEMRAESENRAEAEDRDRPEPPVPEKAEEPEVYTPEEYQLAEQIKAHRLYKEEHGRIPYTISELSHFLIKANIERPLRPDDDDLKAARSKLAAGS
jgi:hypothetical protein